MGGGKKDGKGMEKRREGEMDEGRDEDQGEKKERRKRKWA